MAFSTCAAPDFFHPEFIRIIGLMPAPCWQPCSLRRHIDLITVPVLHHHAC